MGLERANGEEKLKGGVWEKRSGGKRDDRWSQDFGGCRRGWVGSKA